MEIANVRVRLDKLGSDVPKLNVTPAEALVLHVIHQQSNGGSTFGEDMDKIQVTGEATTVEEKDGEKVERPRTNVEEMNRLRRLYGTLTNKKGDKIIGIIFPDRLNPKLPERFSDLHWKEIQFDGAELGSFDYGTSNGAAISL